MATDAAGFVLPLSPIARRPSASGPTRRKKSYLAEEEEIIVKPSTELIPDEYEHITSEDVSFHVFRADTGPEEGFAQDLIESVQKISYKIDKENVHNMDTISEFKGDLDKIKAESKGKSALVLFFIGYFGKGDGTLLMDKEPKDGDNCAHIKEVWSMFSSDKCPELKYKPKIFIFCTSKKPVSMVQTDSIRHRRMDFDKVYDFPAESDMLIVYKKVDDSLSNADFFNQLCFNIESYSKKYDIVDIISYIHNNSRYFPLVISTLTRKFYLTPNNEREHFLSIVETHTYLEEVLQKIQDKVHKLHEAQKKKKEKKFSFSFKRKTEEKPKIVKRNEKPMEPRTSKSGPSASYPSRSSAVNASSKRSRQMSETDSGAARKPIWRV